MRLDQILLGALVLSTAPACGGSAQNTPPPETPAAAAETKPAAEPGEAKLEAAGASEKTSGEPAADDSAAEAAANSGEPDTRTMEVIAATVKEHRKEARACYEKGAKQVPGLKGDLVIHFVLTPRGKVKSAELNHERSTITEPSVVTCVIDVISGIEFPKSSRGMETTVNYPFNFTP